MAPICIEHSIEMGSNTNILDSLTLSFRNMNKTAAQAIYDSYLAKNLMARIFSSALTFTMKSI